MDWESCFYGKGGTAALQASSSTPSDHMPPAPFLRLHSFPINALTYKVAIPSSLSFRAVKEPLGPLCELELGIFNPKLTILLCIVLTWLS
jgi:hypothetical protein